MRFTGILAAALLASLSVFSCGKTADQELKDDLQTAIESAVDSSANGKGLSCAVIMPDGKVWTGAAGISHEGERMTPGHMFSAGSIGKTYTAATVLKMCEAGALSLEDELHQRLPGLRHVNIDRSISLRRLMNHTSGLFDFADNSEYWNAVFEDPSREWTPDETLEEYIKEPLFSQGKDWNYATTNYVLLRKIIQRIGGESVVELYRKRLLAGLGLKNTMTSLGGALPAPLAHGWFDLDNDKVYDEFASWDRTAFASSIGGEVWTTAEDLALWVNELVNRKSVVGKELSKEMLDFHSPCTGEDFIAGYGLGVCEFNPDLTRGAKAWGHAGNALGYGAIAFYLPDYGVTVALMDNTEKAECIFRGLNNVMDVIMKNVPVR